MMMRKTMMMVGVVLMCSVVLCGASTTTTTTELREEQKDLATDFLREVTNRNVNRVKHYLEQVKVDVNVRHPTDHSFALHIAAFNEDVEMLRLLIKSGADIDMQLPSGETALHVASLHNYIAIANILLQSGANTQLIGPGGTPLLIAATNKSQEVLRLLKQEMIRRRMQDYSAPGGSAPSKQTQTKKAPKHEDL
eukprot:TRINITY_DN1697_c1_g1_i1.p1 TRINITY_DN1697_c1_g1~~TRINITY_DN1697_c1_g1_i1.p1  ORF type:complete len:221 (+),score=94.40 TRINITY_DN1697_c1_g1_i1:82-663(+)